MRKRRNIAMDAGTSRDELVAALDHEGNPLPNKVFRSEAHQHGIWHRAVSVFVLNQYGEILIERRSESKDLFPGFYDIVGGHLQPREEPVEAAAQEIYEELKLSVDRSRLEPLTRVDGLIEQIVLP